MDEQDYDVVDTVEVQDATDESWEKTIIFRHKYSKGVCLFFGGADYEGLPDLYSYQHDVLKDSDGDLIVTRVVSDDVGDQKDTEGTVHVDTGDGLVSDTVDHERDLYYGKGVVVDHIVEEDLTID